MRRKRNQLGRAIVFSGGGALVLWLLLRGRRGGHGAGGDGDGDASKRAGQAEPSEPGPRCRLRLSSTGITVDGQPMSRDDAVTACERAGRVDATETGGATVDEWQDLLGALRAAGLTDIVTHTPPAPPR